MNQVSVCRSYDELLTYLGHWEALVREAIEPNVFFEPLFLLPALQHLERKNVLVVLVWRQRELIGLFPIQKHDRWRGLAFRHYRLWKYEHCFLATPLLKRGHSTEAFSKFFDWLRRAGSAFELFELEYMSGSPKVEFVVREAAQSRSKQLRVTTEFTRRVFERKGSYDRFLETRTGHRRRAIRKKWERLSQRGVPCISFLEDGDQLGSWIEDFIRVERSGWKGRNGTALACSPADTAFFRETVRRASVAGQLLLQRLTIDDTPIAMKCSFVSGDEAFAFKIGFDEAFSECSPGMLLEVENVRYLLEQQDRIQRVDSCTAPGESVFDGLWDAERRMMSASLFGSRLLAGAWNLRDAARGIQRKLSPGTLGHTRPTSA